MLAGAWGAGGCGLLPGPAMVGTSPPCADGLVQALSTSTNPNGFIDVQGGMLHKVS